jgi:1-deoxy-D-xylulose-5-phosphate synthase
VVIEDGMRTGGVGTAVSQVLRDANIDVPVRNIGLPDVFLEHGKRAELLKQFGLNSQEISRTIVEAVAIQGGLETVTDASQVQQ